MKYLKRVNFIFISVVFFSCQEKIKSINEIDSIVKNQTILYDNNDFEKALIEDSLRVLKTKRIESEVANLKGKGIVGRWKTNHKRYKTNIIFTEKKSEYQATINFLDSKSKPTINELKKMGNKFLVKGSDVNEFYLINNHGDLELWDNQGLFTVGYDTFPSLETKEKPKFDIDKVLGVNIFTVTGIFSQSNPKTLDGTNNEYWIVYYMDLNTTFKVKKSTMEIEKATFGQIANLK